MKTLTSGDGFSKSLNFPALDKSKRLAILFLGKLAYKKIKFFQPSEERVSRFFSEEVSY